MDACHRLVGAAQIAIEHEYTCVLCGKGRCDGAANPRPGTGNDRGLPMQTKHRLTSVPARVVRELLTFNRHEMLHHSTGAGWHAGPGGRGRKGTVVGGYEVHN